MAQKVLTDDFGGAGWKSFLGANRIFMIWFVSYLMIFIIPLLVNSLVYLKLDSILVRQIKNYNMKILENTRDNIDNIVDQIVNMGIEISLRKSLTESASYRYPLSSEEKLQTKQFISEWATYNLLDLGVKDIVIYYPYSDYIIGFSRCG